MGPVRKNPRLPEPGDKKLDKLGSSIHCSHQTTEESTHRRQQLGIIEPNGRI